MDFLSLRMATEIEILKLSPRLEPQSLVLQPSVLHSRNLDWAVLEPMFPLRAYIRSKLALLLLPGHLSSETNLPLASRCHLL